MLRPRTISMIDILNLLAYRALVDWLIMCAEEERGGGTEQPHFKEENHVVEEVEEEVEVEEAS